MVAKVKNNLKLLESTSDGVATYNLERTLKSYFQNCRKIGVRRIKIDRTPENCSALEKFTEKVTGKAYNFNIFEILGTNKSEGPNLDKFFCSQLVAKGKKFFFK